MPPSTSTLDSPTVIIDLPRPKRLRRLLRFLPLILVLTLLLLGALPASAVVLRDFSQSAGDPPKTPAPTLYELNHSIDLAQQFLDGLYKPLPNSQAVQSEAYGLPLKAHFPRTGKWVLLGEGAAGQCADGDCEATTSIEPREVSESNDESYKISFGTSNTPEALVIHVDIDWEESPSTFAISISPQKVADTVELWLDTTFFTAFSPEVQLPATKVFSTEDTSVLRMLRYTVRHATQEAFLYWQLRGDSEKSTRLSQFLQSNGFTPGLDMRAPMFGESQDLPDDLPFNDKAYADCESLPTADEFAYPYASKACLGVDAYLGASQRDPLLQASQALHTLQKYGPEKTYQLPATERWWLQGSKPAQTAEHLRKHWQRTGYGITSCTPFSCSEPLVSGIRTFVFGALETELGYTYGDATARRYADAAAAITVEVQLGTQGMIFMKHGSVHRPSQAGAFPVSWDTADGRFAPPAARSIIGAPIMLVAGSMSMPAEYMGVQASNSETTFDAWAFLVRYRCAKYSVGCIM